MDDPIHLVRSIIEKESQKQADTQVRPDLWAWNELHEFL
jgi:hypothetical protein